MKVVLIVIAIMVGIAMLALIPWLVGGALAVIFCFWNEWYVAGVICGLFAIFGQIIVGGSVWNDAGKYSNSDGNSTKGGIGFPEMFIAYKIGEGKGKKNDE